MLRKLIMESLMTLTINSTLAAASLILVKVASVWEPSHPKISFISWSLAGLTSGAVISGSAVMGFMLHKHSSNKKRK